MTNQTSIYPTNPPTYQLLTTLRYDPALQAKNIFQPSTVPLSTPLALSGSSRPLPNPPTEPLAFYQADLHLSRLIVSASSLRWTAASATITRTWPSVREFCAWLFKAVRAEGLECGPVKVRLTVSFGGSVAVACQRVDALEWLERDLFPGDFGVPGEILASASSGVSTASTVSVSVSAGQDIIGKSNGSTSRKDVNGTINSNGIGIHTQNPPSINTYGKQKWRIILDTAPTGPTPSTPTYPFSDDPETGKEHYFFKTTFRNGYDAALARCKGRLPEGGPTVLPLLWNAKGEVTEGAYASVYLFREGKWVTPEATALDGAAKVVGAQAGTTRRWALETGLCSVASVKKEDVQVGEVVWMSTGARGFGWGVVEAI